MTVPANITRFLFEIVGNKSAIRVISFQIHEAISEPFLIDLVVAVEEPDIAISGWIKKSGVLTLNQTNQHRLFHGVVISSSQLESRGRFTKCRLRLAPKFWLCNLRSNFRVFQNKSVKEIMATIFSEAGLTTSAYELRLSKIYESREYCVQYNESDFYFISRIMEEEGIFYFFEHHSKGHVMVIADCDACFLDMMPTKSVPYIPPTGMSSGESIIYEFSAAHQITTSTVTVGDFNPKKPKLSLREQVSINRKNSLEFYRYPGRFQENVKGKILASQALVSESLKRTLFKGKSDHQWLEAGRVFALENHTRNDWNSEYLLTVVQHKGSQPLSHEEGASSNGVKYMVSLQAIPKSTSFNPKLSHPKMLIDSSETAVVTGPKGEELYTDEVGRVKVQFHWDREHYFHDNSSCWVRVQQEWAGREWGMFSLPRVGEEVVISFIDGDPDRPMVTGGAYNGLNKAHYELPARKSRIGFKSLSYPGGLGSCELRFEDKCNAEQIYLAVEKDHDISARNDHHEFVEMEKHLTVKGKSISGLNSDDHISVTGEWNQKIGASLSQGLGNDLQLKVSGSLLEQAEQDILVKSGTQISLQAEIQLTLKAGAGMLVLNPAGVSIQGPMVRVNSGGAADVPQGAAPSSPEKPERPEVGRGGKPFMD